MGVEKKNFDAKSTQKNLSKLIKFYMEKWLSGLKR